MKPDIAFYYPGQYWMDVDAMKNLILFFDGIALLIPEYMSDFGTQDDIPVVSALQEHDLFRVVRPETSIGAQETRMLAEALVEVISSGRLDHLIKNAQAPSDRSDFGSLSMSRLGFYGDSELAKFVLDELKERGLAEDSADGKSIPMHRTVRTLILVLLAQILRGKGNDMGVTLSPMTDRPKVVNALNEILPGRLTTNFLQHRRDCNVRHGNGRCRLEQRADRRNTRFS